MPRTYVVQSGDTLSKIGQQFGVPYNQITGYRSGDPNKIYVGENLTIPDTTTPTPATPSPAASIQPSSPTVASVTPTSPQPSQNGLPSEQALIEAMTKKGHTVETAKAAIAGRGIADLAREYLGVSPSQTQSQDVSSILTPSPTLDLTTTYNEAYKNAGIAGLEDDLSKKKEALLQGESITNENPFLSAVEKGGRIAKAREIADREITNLQDQIAKKKADVETQINLKLKQLDINSNASQTALTRFNTLLGLGALTNLGTNDIVNIAKTTGLSTSMIEGAINTAKKKQIEPQVITETDNSGNVTYVMIDKNTGDIIKKQSLGQIGKGKTGTATENVAERKRAVFSEVQKELDRLGGSDKFVSPQEWQYLRQQWVGQGYEGKEFDDAFRQTYVGTPKDRGFKLSDFGLK